MCVYLKYVTLNSCINCFTQSGGENPPVCDLVLAEMGGEMASGLRRPVDEDHLFGLHLGDQFLHAVPIRPPLEINKGHLQSSSLLIEHSILNPSMKETHNKI